MDLIKLIFVVLVGISAYDFFNKYLPKKPVTKVKATVKIKKKAPTKRK
tara:strand:- start:707 stop:850 length:144 start_codon:yes stop_codon:yes gene_type:complete